MVISEQGNEVKSLKLYFKLVSIEDWMGEINEELLPR